MYESPKNQNAPSASYLKPMKTKSGWILFKSMWDRNLTSTQKRNRFPPKPAATSLPPDAQAIIILVELIHNPGMSIDEMMLNITSAYLFPTSALIHFRPESNTCPTCHESLKVLKTYPGRKAATFAIGNFTGHETVYYCQGCGHLFHSNELRTLIPENCNFGYDIIRKRLRKHNVRVILRRTKKRLEKIIVSTTTLVPEVVRGIEHERLPAE